MTYTVPRSVVDQFREVYTVRDADKLVGFLHDDVEWTINGPVEYLQFCGVHRGKEAVRELIKYRIPKVLRTFNFVPESILVDGDQVAMLHRQSSRRTLDNRVINYRVANFIRFRDGKVLQNLSLLDTFDAVEQVLGHRLGVANANAPEGDLVAI
jgi:ketosteroid isomerase-like protein